MQGRFVMLLALAALLGACSGAPEAAVSGYVARLQLSVHNAANYTAAPIVPAAIGTPPLATPSKLSAEALLGADAELIVRALGGDSQGHLALLGHQALWQISRGRGAVVAVIDSGVAPEHPALAGALLPGYDFIRERPEMIDESGHGTGIAAIIAGRGPIWGLAPEAMILPLRVLNGHNQGSVREVVRAILYAVDLLEGAHNPYPADIINLSLGSAAYSPGLHQAIQLARAQGALVIAASGNLGQAQLSYPAALPEVLAVGAAEARPQGWQRAPYSNYGEGLALLAPLGGLMTTNTLHYAESGVLTASAPQGSARQVGTSYAAAQVSGIAALLKAAGAQTAQLATLLRDSASDLLAPGWDRESGFGLLNAAAALRAARGSSPDGPIAVQVVDATSLQEVAFETGSERFELLLVPGDYRVKVWQDISGDGLHQEGEPTAQLVVQLRQGALQQLEVSLR